MIIVLVKWVKMNTKDRLEGERILKENLFATVRMFVKR
jgi:hypothetical protein